MSKRTIKKAKGFVDNRFFLAIIEIVNGKKVHLAVEKTASGAWARHTITAGRFNVLCGKLGVNNAKSTYNQSLANSIERELVASYK